MHHVVHLICSNFFGGPERQILGLSTHLSCDYRNSLVVFSESGKCKDIQFEAWRRGIHCYAISDDFSNTFSLVEELKRVLIGIEADILCCHGYKANLVGSQAAKAIDLPFIVVLRGWTGENCKVKAYEYLDKVLLSSMSSIVCLSKAQIVEIQNVGVSPEKIKLIPNAINLERFSNNNCWQLNCLSKYFPTFPRMVCCSAGRLSPEKGFHDLIYVAKELKKKNHHIAFVLFGDGPLRTSLNQLIIQEGLEEYFILAGFTTNLDNILVHCDVLLISSYTEGIPNILLEGFAAGIPVVATRVGGIPDLIIDGQNGFLVNPGDVYSMAERILLLAGDRHLRWNIGTRGRQFVEKHLSFFLQAERYKEVFRELNIH